MSEENQEDSDEEWECFVTTTIRNQSPFVKPIWLTQLVNTLHQSLI